MLRIYSFSNLRNSSEKSRNQQNKNVNIGQAYFLLAPKKNEAILEYIIGSWIVEIIFALSILHSGLNQVEKNHYLCMYIIKIHIEMGGAIPDNWLFWTKLSRSFASPNR
jgi:hypothetical protein